MSKPIGRLWQSLLFAIFAASAWAQTTQGLIFGRITDDVDRHPLAAKVSATHLESGARFDAAPDNAGFYVIPLVPPGQCNLWMQPARIE